MSYVFCDSLFLLLTTQNLPLTQNLFTPLLTSHILNSVRKTKRSYENEVVVFPEKEKFICNRKEKML